VTRGGKHVALFAYPDFGHQKPTVELIRQLVARGHRVTYVVDEALSRPVVEAGSALLGYRSPNRGATSNGAMTPEQIGRIGLDFLTESIEVILPLARRHFATDVPDLVVYDYESCVTARTLAAEWERPTVQFSPTFASNETYSLYTDLFAPDDPAIYRTFEVIQKFLGDGDLASPAFWSLLAASDPHHNIVFLPREFQPHGESFDERFTFVGHSAGAGIDHGLWSPPAGDTPVVLASLGTFTNNRPEFFRTCAEAFADKQWHVVMTVGRGNLPPPEWVDAPNIEVHEWLPHPAVLPHAEVMITHGGMSGVVEALSFGTPMVVVPHILDQFVIARRVGELGLGETIQSEDFTASNLRHAVDSVARERRARPRPSADMRQAISTGGGAARAADVLEGLW
jgi:MGT family glycosyltransferase